MKQILATFPLRNFLRVFALVTAVSATSCSKDPAVDGELHGDMLRFAVAEADGWNTQLRCGAAGSEEKSAASPENVAEVFSLRGENPADTLFLHASVADGIAAPYPNVQTDRLQTRATPVETGTFYGFVRRIGFGLYGDLERGFLLAGLYVRCRGDRSIVLDDLLLLARCRTQHPFLRLRALWRPGDRSFG